MTRPTLLDVPPAPPPTPIAGATGTIQHAVRVLAGVCDGAATRDDIGFNGTDSTFGHAIARVPDEQWTSAQLATAHAILRKYRRQLATAGLDYDTLTAPHASHHTRVVRLIDTDGRRLLFHFNYDPLLSGALTRALPGAAWDRQAKAWEVPARLLPRALTFAAQHEFAVSDAARNLPIPQEAPPAAGTIDICAVADGFAFAIRFRDYDPKLVAAVRDLPGRAYNTASRYWTVPLEQVRAVRALAAAHGLTPTPAAQAVPDVAPDNRPAITYRANTSGDGGAFWVKHAHDEQTRDLVRALPGAQWTEALASWRVPDSAAVEIAQLLDRVDCRTTPDVHIALEHVPQLLAQIAESEATEAPLHPALHGVLARELYPFQRAGVQYAVNHRRTFIGDQMGLGKTPQAIASLEAMDAYPALVVAPSLGGLLKTNWAREIRAWTPHRTVEIIDGRRAMLLPAADLYVINYDILDAHAENLLTLGLRGVVFDESHYLSNPRTVRGKAALAIAAGLPQDAPRLLLTGTFSSGKVAETVHQLEVMGTLTHFGGRRGFLASAKDRRELPALNRKMRAHCLVRRLKDDVLTDLPPRRWTVLPVEGEPAAMEEYRRAEQDLLKHLADHARARAAFDGATTDEAERAAHIASERAGRAYALVQIGVLRQIAARAKLPAAKAWLADTNEKVICFGWHTAIVDEIAEQFADGCRIQGGTPAAQRQAAVDRFQTDPQQRLIACQMKAAGVGITLTASSNVLFIEQGWTPTDMDQAVDRAHRIGQTDSVTGWVMVVPKTVDEDIAELISKKRTTVNALMDGQVGTDDGGSVLTDLVDRLTDRALTTHPHAT